MHPQCTSGAVHIKANYVSDYVEPCTGNSQPEPTLPIPEYHLMADRSILCFRSYSSPRVLLFHHLPLLALPWYSLNSTRSSELRKGETDGFWAFGLLDNQSKVANKLDKFERRETKVDENYDCCSDEIRVEVDRSTLTLASET